MVKKPRFLPALHSILLSSILQHSDEFKRFFRLDALAKALRVIATATWLGGWLGGWVSVTLRYCIKTAKPIGKHFRPPESPIILVF